MHIPRLPALNHTLTSALWGIGLGVFIWIGLLSVEITSRLNALLCGIVGGIVIFLYVLIFGDQFLTGRVRKRRRHHHRHKS
jgi:hypothetical protein